MEFGPATVKNSMYTDVIWAPLSEMYKLPVAVKEFGSDPLFSELLDVVSSLLPRLQFICDNSWLLDSESPIVLHLSVFFSAQPISLAELIPALFCKC